MKATDLMLGDLVTFKDCQLDENPVIIKIWQINGDGDAFVSINETDGLDEISIDDEVVGIPLTPEILENNGFTVGKYKLPMADKEIDKFSLSEVGDDYVREVVLLPITMNCTWCFSSVDGTYIPVIEFVHELQHALRLAGIEKEIIL